MFSYEKLNSVLASCDFFNAMKDMKQNQLLCFMTLISRHFKREGPILLHHGNIKCLMRLAKTTVLLSFFIDFMTKRQINGLQTCYVILFLKNQANSYMFHSYEWTNENMNLLLKTEGKKKPWMKRVIPK